MSAGNAVFIAMGGFGIGFDLVSTRNARGSRLPWFTARSNDTKDAPAASTNPFFNANTPEDLAEAEAYASRLEAGA